MEPKSSGFYLCHDDFISVELPNCDGKCSPGGKCVCVAFVNAAPDPTNQDQVTEGTCRPLVHSIGARLAGWWCLILQVC